MASETVLEVGNANFSATVESATTPVLLDFWASWCAPCRALAPIVEEVASEMNGKVVVGKVNTDEESELATRFGIRSIPTLIVFKDGKEVDRLIGLKSKDDIVSSLEAQI